MNIPPEPRLILLGDTSPVPRHDNNKIRLLKIAYATANKCIALKWKDEHPPMSTLWLNNLTSCIPSERIMYNLKQKPDDFEGIWHNLINYMEKGDLED